MAVGSGIQASWCKGLADSPQSRVLLFLRLSSLQLSSVSAAWLAVSWGRCLRHKILFIQSKGKLGSEAPKPPDGSHIATLKEPLQPPGSQKFVSGVQALPRFRTTGTSALKQLTHVDAVHCLSSN